MVPRVVYCLLTIVMLVAVASAQDKLQETLLAQEKLLIDAINNKDKAAIRELLAGEAMSITASRGLQTTAEIVAGLEKISFTNYKITDVKTVSVSPDVAILTYKFSWTGGVTGQPATTTTAYATSVWKQRHGKWSSVFYQETPIAARKAPA
ncbi:MAG: nuclear transport factor 2 family protein [Planctomycetes bacterium]|nr:nuclear transport factor 2 family protein [Planctomycetota bacterium]